MVVKCVLMTTLYYDLMYMITFLNVELTECVNKFMALHVFCLFVCLFFQIVLKDNLSLSIFHQ